MGTGQAGAEERTPSLAGLQLCIRGGGGKQAQALGAGRQRGRGLHIQGASLFWENQKSAAPVETLPRGYHQQASFF